METLTLGLLALGILGGTLLGSVEPQVLEEEDLSILAVLDSLLGLGSNAVGKEGDRLGKELLKLLGLEVRLIWGGHEGEI